jgi:hypothetical protein
VFTVASSFLSALRRRPVLFVALLVVMAALGAKLGLPIAHVNGMWDGPI